MDRYESANIILCLFVIVISVRIAILFYKKTVGFFRRKGGGYLTNDFVEKIKAMGSTAKPHQRI